MVAHLLRLRLDLLWGATRGNRQHRIRTIATFTAVVIGVIAGCSGLLFLRDVPTDVAAVVTAIGGAGLTLGFALGPILTGVDDQLDPRRFLLLGLEPRPLAAALGFAGLISVPIAAVLALAVCVVILWTSHGVPWYGATLGVLFGVATCALLARVSMAVAGQFLRVRRSRELTGVFVLLLIVVVVPVAVFLASIQWRGRVPSQIRAAAEWLALTPLSSGWAFPASLAAGWDAANAVLVSFGFLVLLGLAWMWLVERALTATGNVTRERSRSGLGWFAVAPPVPGGAIAARSLIYWIRDRRYIMNLLVVPVVALLAMVPFLVAGLSISTAVLVAPPLIALFLGWLPHNDVAYDSTAIWLHLSSGVRGLADRVGRIAPVLLIGTPLLVVSASFAVAVHGRWAVLPAMAGLCACLFLSGLGLSSIASVVAPYAVSQPGDSPFRQPQRTGSTGFLSQSVVLVGAMLLSAPTFSWAWRAAFVDPTSAQLASWTGVVIGLTVMLAGLGFGAVMFERRGGRLMEFAEAA